MEYKERQDRLMRILDDLESGKVNAEDVHAEIEELTETSFPGVASLIAAKNILDRFEAGKVSPMEAETMLRSYADLHPTIPILFIYCARMALERDDHLHCRGYLALFVRKRDQLEESDFGRDDETEKPFAPLVEKMEEEPEHLEIWPYFEEGGDHLVNHFLVQELIEGCITPAEDELIELIADREKDLAPLLLSMLEDQLYLCDLGICEAPIGLDAVIAMVGMGQSLAALPVLTNSLIRCGGGHLNETVLALARLGSHYPEAVSLGLRSLADNQQMGEIRLAAIDTLGLLWEASGNFDFLCETLEKLAPETECYSDLFMFLAHALLSSLKDEAARVVSSALEKHRESLDEGAILFVEDYLRSYLDIQLGPRLLDIQDEELEDLFDIPISDLMLEFRSTLTMQREQLFMEVERAQLELIMVEEQLRAPRNLPCPCGSGIKFKKCCLSRLRELRDSLASGEQSGPRNTTFALITEQLERFSRAPSIREERGDALEVFLTSVGRDSFEKGFEGYNDSLEETIFMEWFLMARPLEKSGRTVAEKLLEEQGENLDHELLALLRSLVKSRFSVLEVREVVPGESILFGDVFRGGEVEVVETTASRNVVKWDILAMRLVELNGRNLMMGVVFQIPREHREPLESFVKRASEEMIAAGRVDDLDGFLQLYGFLVFHQVRQLQERQTMPTMITPEGDLLTFCEAVYDISDPQEARRRLADHPWMEEEPGGGSGVMTLSWLLSRELEDELRAGEHLGGQNPMRTFSTSPKEMTEEEIEAMDKDGLTMRGFGTLKLQGSRLTFETQSRERLEKGKREIEAVLPGLALHRADALEDQEATLGEAWANRDRAEAPPPGAATRRSGEPDIPPEVKDELIRAFLEKAYANWLDEPIPYLGDMTPRDAAKTPEGRRKVDQLLKDYENKAERQRRQGIPDFDFSRFRRELDIWPGTG